MLKLRKVFSGFYSGTYKTKSGKILDIFIEKKDKLYYGDCKQDSDVVGVSSSLKKCLTQMKTRLKNRGY